MSKIVKASNYVTNSAHRTGARHVRGPLPLHISVLAVLLLIGSQRVEASSRHHDGSFDKPFRVKLHKESKASLEGVEKNFFVGSVAIGEPEKGEQQQKFNMVFDLGSGQVVLPSVRCNLPTCTEHNRFDKWASKRAVDVNADGHPVLEHTTPAPRMRGSRAEAGKSAVNGKKVVRDLANIGVDFIDHGSGQVKGELIKDLVCLTPEADGERRCFELGLVVAMEMSELPFRVMPNDGIIGLGLEALTIGRDFSFLTRFGDRLHSSRSRSKQQFGLWLGKDISAGGELTFGGYDEQRLATPSSLTWTPVLAPEKGFWQMAIVAVRVGGKEISLCDGPKGEDGAACRGAVETGAVHFSVSQELGVGLEDALRLAGGSTDQVEGVEAVGADGQVLPTRRTRGYGSGLVNIELVLEGGGVLSLHPEDFVSSSPCAGEPEGENCRPLIERHSIPEDVGRGLFILGENILRRYYTVFDWGENRIGFGLAAGEDPAPSLPAPPKAAAAAKVSEQQAAPEAADAELPAEATTTKNAGRLRGFLGKDETSTVVLLQTQSSVKSIDLEERLET